jgi:CheY-like chemotaxis protein
VALTGWGTEEDKRQSRLAGFDFHLTKPVSAEMLAQVMGQFA